MAPQQPHERGQPRSLRLAAEDGFRITCDVSQSLHWIYARGCSRRADLRQPAQL